jgi:hypothetical protein
MYKPHGIVRELRRSAVVVLLWQILSSIFQYVVVLRPNIVLFLLICSVYCKHKVIIRSQSLETLCKNHFVDKEPVD